MVHNALFWIFLALSILYLSLLRWFSRTRALLICKREFSLAFWQERGESKCSFCTKLNQCFSSKTSLLYTEIIRWNIAKFPSWVVHTVFNNYSLYYYCISVSYLSLKQKIYLQIYKAPTTAWNWWASPSPVSGFASPSRSIQAAPLGWWVRGLGFEAWTEGIVRPGKGPLQNDKCGWVCKWVDVTYW